MVAERRREKEVIKRRFAELVSGSPEIRAFLDETLALFNGKRGEPHSFDLLEQLLQEQCYRLSYWRVASDELVSSAGSWWAWIWVPIAYS